MRVLRVVLVALSALLIAAHFLREGSYPVVLLSLAFPLLLFVKAEWARWAVEVLLVLAGIEWIRTLFALVAERQALEQSYTVAAIILGIVAAFTFASAIVLESSSEKRESREE